VPDKVAVCHMQRSMWQALNLHCIMAMPDMPDMPDKCGQCLWYGVHLVEAAFQHFSPSFFSGKDINWQMWQRSPKAARGLATGTARSVKSSGIHLADVAGSRTQSSNSDWR
jgi:hypothetical protein